MAEETPKNTADGAVGSSTPADDAAAVEGDAQRASGPAARLSAPAIPRPISAFAPRGGEVAPETGWTPGTPAVEAALAASALEVSPTGATNPAPAPEAKAEHQAQKSKEQPKQPAKAGKAIRVMKVVRVQGKTGRPPPPAPAEGAEPLEELSDDDIEERLSRPSADDLTEEVASADSNPTPDLPTSSRRPPPRRDRGSSPPVPPSARAVEKALQAPRFDPSKKRGRMWWEELFTDDFGRAIPPLGEQVVKREVDFIERSLGVAQGGVVLDLACGLGYHAVELASRGYNVVGYDLSVSQLAEASERAQERDVKLNFLQGDMREMAFENTFDGIYCWNTSFGYFEEEKNIHVAKRVFSALKSGGSFLLDVVNRDFAVVQQPNQNWFEGDACICMDDMSVDFITSRLRVKRTVMLDDGRTRECTYSVRIYGLHELGKLLHDIGFKVIQASGQPAVPGVFFGAQSPRVIILAAKP